MLRDALAHIPARSGDERGSSFIRHVCILQVMRPPFRYANLQCNELAMIERDGIFG
jgi:hypothetical protein